MKTIKKSALFKLVVAFVTAAMLIFYAGKIWAEETKNGLVTGILSVQKNEPRMALIIGNGAYRSAAPLKNAPNDARAMAATLTENGFTVIYRQNATHKEMTSLIRQFGDGLRNGGVGLFYYAGHGMQVRGRNYLIPVDAEIEREDEIAYSAIDANLVLEKMQSANNRLNILILDACRNNPFARSFRSGTQGLAQMDAPVGTLVAFATAPGSVASDGDGENGLYTRYLLDNIKQPGIRVEDVFKNVRAAVRRDSGGKQIPWESTSLEGDFYFKMPIPAAAPAVNASSMEKNQSRNSETFELAFWDAIKTSTNAEDYRAYLAQYPNGSFAGLARNRIAAYQSQTSSSTKPPGPAEATVPPVALQNRLNAASGAVPRRTNEAVYEGIMGAPIKSGDRWEYAITDLFRNSNIRTEVLQVEEIDADGIQYVDQKLRTDYSGLNLITGLEGNKYSPSNEVARFPLEVGKQWSGTFTETTETGRVSVNTYKAIVVRKEKVHVPSGTFDTYYIEQNIHFKGIASGSADSSALTSSASSDVIKRIWYSPEVKNVVKFEIKLRNGSRKYELWEQRELIRYKIN